jgi:hypothetical protein
VDGPGPQADERTVAVVSADGRICSAQPVAGGGLGVVTGLSVLATSEEDIRAALDWMPGRILVLAESALEPRALALAVPSAHMATLGALVLLGEQGRHLGVLAAVDGVLPVVRVERATDQRSVRRALRLIVDVHPEAAPTLDLRPHHRPRGHRTVPAARSPHPGLVRH